MAVRRGRPTYRAYLLLLVVICASCLFIGQHHAAEQGNRQPEAAVTGLVEDVSALPFASRIGVDDSAKKFGVFGDVPPGAPPLLVTAAVVLVAAAVNHRLRLRLGALASRAPPVGAAVD